MITELFEYFCTYSGVKMLDVAREELVGKMFASVFFQRQGLVMKYFVILFKEELKPRKL